jgi:chorismate synthase
MSFRFLTAGESHGQALVGILEGLPAGLTVTVEALHDQLRRRKLGFGRGARQNIETDAIEILSGVRLGQTLGSPIALLMWNKDWANWSDIMAVAPHEAGGAQRRLEVPRPGHADRVGGLKYDHADMRNVLERSSARETAMRVALGSVARLLCEAVGIHVASRVVSIGAAHDTSPCPTPVHTLNALTDASPVRCSDGAAAEAMMADIQAAALQGNTLGGTFEVVASGLPAGLGSYVHWDRRLEAEIGRMFLSLNAIKGVEIGLGFEAARRLGSLAQDALALGPEGEPCYASNHSGGLEGGMTTGQTLRVRAAMKPLSTLQKPLPSIHVATGQPALAHVERSDVCAVPAAAVIGESLLCLVLAQSLLEKFGGDAMSEMVPRVEHWRRQAQPPRPCP